MSGPVRRLLGKVGAPVISQGLTAGTSLLLQVVAARVLGLTEYGSFALFISLLVSATALYSGYVGDSLAVLDRMADPTRPALVSSVLSGLSLCFAIAVGAVLVLLHGDLVTGLLYAVMLVGWLVEETFRRLLMARLEFWKLVGNDLAYLLGTAIPLGAWFLTAHTMSLRMIFAAMGVGTVAAIVTGIAQLPRRELRGLRPGWAGMRAVLAFAGWRSLQATLRPAALLLTRLLVANLISLTAVGVLEAGRLVVAPLQVIINGAGSFLLSGFAAAQHRGAGAGRSLVFRAALLLTGVTMGGGLLLSLFAHPLGSLMTGSPVDPLLLLGWVVYLGVWAAGLPYVTETVARRLSRAVFVTRLVDSVIGLVLATAGLVAGLSLTTVPWLLAVGGLYSVWRMRSIAVRTRPAPGAEGTETIGDAEHTETAEAAGAMADTVITARREPATDLIRRNDIEATVRIPHL